MTVTHYHVMYTLLTRTPTMSWWGFDCRRRDSDSIRVITCIRLTLLVWGLWWFRLVAHCVILLSLFMITVITSLAFSHHLSLSSRDWFLTWQMIRYFFLPCVSFQRCTEWKEFTIRKWEGNEDSREFHSFLRHLPKAILFFENDACLSPSIKIEFLF